MSQWDAHAPPKQSPLPIIHTTHARTTQISHARVQNCTAHPFQQTLTQSFQHTALLGQQNQGKHHILALKESKITGIIKTTQQPIK